MQVTQGHAGPAGNSTWRKDASVVSGAGDGEENVRMAVLLQRSPDQTLPDL